MQTKNAKVVTSPSIAAIGVQMLSGFMLHFLNKSELKLNRWVKFEMNKMLNKLRLVTKILKIEKTHIKWKLSNKAQIFHKIF